MIVGMENKMPIATEGSENGRCVCSVKLFWWW